MPPEDTTIPLGLCQCGCGRATTIPRKSNAHFGYVKGQPLRFVRGHSSRIPTTRDWVEEDRGFTTPCHIWQRCRLKGGYGQFYPDGYRAAPQMAHRVWYERRYGPIPDGLDLDHLCRQRDCVNPDHLEAVTAQVNNQRGSMAKLTPEDVRSIRALQGKEHAKVVAEMFGVHSATIYCVWNRDSWQNVE